MRPRPDPTPMGQESVWDYPRPAMAELSSRHVRIEHQSVVVAHTRAAFRVLETSHPPSWYLPPDSIAGGLLQPSPRRSFCEWKGDAVYWHLEIGDELLLDVGWSYPELSPAFVAMRDHVAFYAARLGRCLVDGEPVTLQPGGFYGGCITPDVVGPLKGVPGSAGW
jgi:uncharacterized protein (DUF427 family)